MPDRNTTAIYEIAKEYPKHLVKEGEIDVYDESILSAVIRKREFKMISAAVSFDRRKTVLDYGCGPGWLSKFLAGKRMRVVGIEINRPLLKHARKISPTASFVACDGHSMPFRNEIYDSIVGISILHHMKLDTALKELRRVAKKNSGLMFMEPNPLNILSAFGRRFFPTEAHTASEKPFLSKHLTELMHRLGFRNIKTRYILFMSFPIARFFKIRNMKPSPLIVKFVNLAEDLIEQSFFNRLSSTLVVEGVS